jgi:RNA-binding motif X-linked protein 2
VRDKGTGKSLGFAFVKYENQRSTILAVDNFNGIKLLGRVIRCDHVDKYKLPKEVRVREEEMLAEDPNASLRIGPGHAYKGQELASAHNINAGVNLWDAPVAALTPVTSTNAVTSSFSSSSSLLQGDSNMLHKSNKHSKHHHDRKSKHHNRSADTGEKNKNKGKKESKKLFKDSKHKHEHRHSEQKTSKYVSNDRSDGIDNDDLQQRLATAGTAVATGASSSLSLSSSSSSSFTGGGDGAVASWRGSRDPASAVHLSVRAAVPRGNTSSSHSGSSSSSGRAGDFSYVGGMNRVR